MARAAPANSCRPPSTVSRAPGAGMEIERFFAVCRFGRVGLVVADVVGVVSGDSEASDEDASKDEEREETGEIKTDGRPSGSAQAKVM